MQNFDERNYKKIGELLENVFKEYAAKENSMTDEEFLRQMFARHLPKISEEKIDEMCQEILESNRNMENFLEEAKKSPAYENATQNWFCEKIKDSLGGGDYALIQRLCMENEILDAINSNSIQISNDFDKFAEASMNKKGSSSVGEIISQESHTEKKAASTSAARTVSRSRICSSACATAARSCWRSAWRPRASSRWCSSSSSRSSRATISSDPTP